MKKSLHNQNRRIKRILTKRHRRSIISNSKARCKRAGVSWRGKKVIERFAAPFAFNILGEQNRATVIKFIRRVRNAVLSSNSRVILDFSEPEVLQATAVLLFVAELDRMKRIKGSDFSVTIEKVRVPRVSQVLKQVGVYSLCGEPRIHTEEDNFEESVKHWRYATGVRAGDESNEAFESFEGRLSPEIAKGMWKGVSEAVVNSVQHAYAAPRFAGEKRLGHSRWWMFSHERDGMLSVAVCDLGIGIPRSLPLNWEPSVLERLLSIFSADGPDVRSIRAALEVGASSTGKAHRGKGLPQIWNTIRDTPGGSIAIHSNHAQLSWSQTEGKEFSHEYATSIDGTMIVWTVNTIDENARTN